MEMFELKEIDICKGIHYEYSVPEKVRKYFNNVPFFVEYSDDIDLHSIPKGVLMVPFVANMLTISMLTGCGIKVPCLDKTFYKSISKIKDVYRAMFPYLNLTFYVEADSIEDCSYESSKCKSLFFTGGLDATSALASVNNKNLILINVWGGRRSFS